MGRRNTFARVGRPRAGLALVVAQGVIAGPALSALAPGVALQPGAAVEHQPDVEVRASLPMAATNKCLAPSNKSCRVSDASEHRRGPPPRGPRLCSYRAPIKKRT